MAQFKTTTRIGVTALLAVVIFVADIFSQAPPTPGQRRIVMLDGREVVEGEVIIRYRSRTGATQRQRAEYQADSDASELVGQLGTRRLRSRNMTTRQMLTALRANPDVELVEPNYIIRAASMPNDPSFGNLWGLLNTGQVVDGQTGTPGADIDAVPAWDTTTGSRSNIVAILDTGIDFDHPDLAANIFSSPRRFSVTIGSVNVTCGEGTHGFNALTKLCVPFDDNGHGTHIAGIVGALGNNNLGVTGVNWIANIMGLKVLGADGTGTTTDAISAIDFAIQAKTALGADGNIRVLNASWGGSTFSQALDDEIQAANNADMLFVAAAGTNGRDTDAIPHYPGSSTRSNVISVTAVDNTGELAAFSNYGATTVDLGAPGASTLSTLPSNSYGQLSGTSMAAPFVSGAAALVLSGCQLSTAALKSALLSSVDPATSLYGKSVSGGRLNVQRALSTGCPGLTHPVPAISSLSPFRAAVNGPSFTLSVTGTGFVSTSVVRVDGAARTTTFVSSTSLTATIPSSDITSIGTRAITVFNPAPGGGTSGSATLTVTPPIEMTVNGTTGALTVAPGSMLTVVIKNGPANPWDYLTVVPIGAPADTWTGDYRFLNGTTTAPNPGLSDATVTMPMPSSPGNYELRFLANGWYDRLATSGPITSTTSNPVPAITSLSPSSIAAGSSAKTVTVSGSGFTSASVVRLNGSARTTTYVSSTALSAAIPASDLTSVGTAAITVFNPTPGGGTSNTATLNIVTAPPAATMTVNGSSGAISVSPGANLTVSVTGGPANSWDYLTIVPVGSAPDTWTGYYRFLNGTTTPPNPGLSSGTVTLTAPTTPGNYEVRFNANGWYDRLATSGTITVATSTPPPPPPGSTTMTVNGTTGAQTVSAGAMLTIVVANGPGHAWDYVTVVPAGSAADTWSGNYKFLNDTTNVPNPALTGGTVHLAVPTTPGNYEVRFNADGWYTRIATSGVITVSSSVPSGASMTVNGTTYPITVARGSTLTIAVTNGPGNSWDYVTLVPAGSATDTWTGNYRFLNDTTTAPNPAMTSGTAHLTVPATPGTYEVRFNADGWYTRIATSATITVP